MANPQPENGFIKIANEIATFLAGYRIPGVEYQVLWVILIKTWGWNKKDDHISLSQFSALTKQKRPNVVRALCCLIDKNIIIKNDNDRGSIYRINKDFDTWKPLSKVIPPVSKVITSVIKSDNKSLSKVIHSKDNTKDTLSKERGSALKIFIPPSKEMVEAYCRERKNNINPDNFINFYESKGWMVGKTKMKNWQAAVRTWEAREKENKPAAFLDNIRTL